MQAASICWPTDVLPAQQEAAQQWLLSCLRESLHPHWAHLPQWEKKSSFVKSRRGKQKGEASGQRKKLGKMFPPVSCGAAGLSTFLQQHLLHTTRPHHNPAHHILRKIPRKACSEIQCQSSLGRSWATVIWNHSLYQEGLFFLLFIFQTKNKTSHWTWQQSPDWTKKPQDT